jgi:glucuronate isomerase
MRAGAKGIVQSTDLVPMGLNADGELTLLHHPTGANQTRKPDWVVLAVPPNPVEWLYNDLKAAGVSVQRVGDCVAPRRAHAAVVDSGVRFGIEHTRRPGGSTSARQSTSDASTRPGRSAHDDAARDTERMPKLIRDVVAGGTVASMAQPTLRIDDGLVLQIHPGSFRNHNPQLFARFGRDMGADMPTGTDYVRALKPLLDRFGNERDLTIILFTLDETSYSRELAPLAGHYPALRLGPAWWFYDAPHGMRRFRELTTETAGFYNTVGFNDDTRAFCSIPARHDVARRVDCAYLADLVVEHRLEEDEAAEVAVDLAYRLAKRAYKL